MVETNGIPFRGRRTTQVSPFVWGIGMFTGGYGILTHGQREKHLFAFCAVVFGE